MVSGTVQTHPPRVRLCGFTHNSEGSMKYFIGLSGGKDSATTWLIAKERGVDATPVFCDTGQPFALFRCNYETAH